MKSEDALRLGPAEDVCALLDMGRARQASDVHVDPAAGVAFRIFSRIERLPHVSLSATAIDAFLASTFDALSRARLQKIGMADSAYADASIGGLRIHASKARHGYRLAIRLLPADLPTLESLLLPEAFAALGLAQSGLVIVAGPGGSGKTTAIVGLLASLCARSALHVVTIERTIEHFLPWQNSIVSQYEVGRDVATFADGVRGALSSDSNVIFAGELFGLDTFTACLEAAEAGRLVLGALTAPAETPLALSRLVGFFPSEEQERGRQRLAHALRGVLGIRLLPTRDGTGLRAGVELLLVSEPLRRLIRDGHLQQVRGQISSSAREGMQTLESALSALVAEGALELAVARAASQYPDEVYAAPLDARRS